MIVYSKDFRYTGSDSHDLAADICAAMRLGLSVDAASGFKNADGKTRVVHLLVTAPPEKPGAVVGDDFADLPVPGAT